MSTPSPGRRRGDFTDADGPQPGESELQPAVVSPRDAAVTGDSNGVGENDAASLEKPGGYSVYGQNQSLAEQDRQLYQERLEAEEPQPTADGFGGGPAGIGATVAEGQVIGVDDHHGAWNGSPAGLIVGDTEDIFVVLPYSRLNALCIVINFVIAAVCFSTNNGRADILTLIIGIIATVMGFVMLWMTRSVRLVFNRYDEHLRVEERRLIRLCCGPVVALQARFDELDGAGYDALIGTPGDLYLEVAGTRVCIGHRLYETRAQMMLEVMPWRTYIAGLRGLTPQEFEVAMMLRHVASAIAQRAASRDVRQL